MSAFVCSVALGGEAFVSFTVLVRSLVVLQAPLLLRPMIRSLLFWVTGVPNPLLGLLLML